MMDEMKSLFEMLEYLEDAEFETFEFEQNLLMKIKDEYKGVDEQ